MAQPAHNLSGSALQWLSRLSRSGLNESAGPVAQPAQWLKLAQWLSGSAGTTPVAQWIKQLSGSDNSAGAMARLTGSQPEWHSRLSCLKQLSGTAGSVAQPAHWITTQAQPGGEGQQDPSTTHDPSTTQTHAAVH